MLCHCDRPHAGPASLDNRHVIQIEISEGVLVLPAAGMKYFPKCAPLLEAREAAILCIVWVEILVLA